MSDILSSAVSASRPHDAPEVGEESLDPSSWDDFRAITHGMVDDMVDYISTVRERPVWTPVPAEVRAEIAEDRPIGPQPLDRVYAEFVRNVLPYPTGNIHPRFWANVMGTGAPVSILAEMLSAAMNSNSHGYDQSSVLVEQQAIRWFTDVFGFPKSATGIFVNGGTMANIVGLMVARNTRFGIDVAHEGVAAAQNRFIYTSDQAHAWLKRACNLLGIGHKSIRVVSSDATGRIDVAALKAMIGNDQARGTFPFCVCANAGTVGTGAVDDLDALADICRDEGMWLHVDGAFGAMAMLAPDAKHVLNGIERADSIAFDLHKWGFMSYDIGCAIVRDSVAHRAAFANPASYLAPAASARGFAASYADAHFEVTPYYFSDLGLQLSRGFHALKVWMSVKTYGFAKIGAVIQRNISQAHRFGGLVDRSDEVELLTPVSLNVVLYRVTASGLSEAEIERLNRAVLERIQLGGDAMPSSTDWHGVFALRIAITNHRTTDADIDRYFELLRETRANCLIEVLEERTVAAS